MSIDGALKCVKKLVSNYSYYTAHEGAPINNKETQYVIHTDNNDEPVGCIGIHNNNMIIHLRVSKNKKQNGIGTKLLKSAEKIIFSKGKQTATAYVNINNKVAISFFKKNNYSITGFADSYLYQMTKKM